MNWHSYFQLQVDYDTTNEPQIRNTFKLDSCGELYAPAWLKLRLIKKSEEHIKLGKSSNVQKRRNKEGKWVDRDAPEIPSKSELEMKWLEKYIGQFLPPFMSSWDHSFSFSTFYFSFLHPSLELLTVYLESLDVEGGYGEGKGKGKAKDKGKGKAIVKASPRKNVQPKKAAVCHVPLSPSASNKWSWVVKISLK